MTVPANFCHRSVIWICHTETGERRKACLFFARILALPPLRLETVTASLLLRKLASYPRQNGLSWALREVGRLEKTLFTLEWLQSVEPSGRIISSWDLHITLHANHQIPKHARRDHAP
jgi:hypothetical protein